MLDGNASFLIASVQTRCFRPRVFIPLKAIAEIARVFNGMKILAVLRTAGDIGLSVPHRSIMVTWKVALPRDQARSSGLSATADEQGIWGTT